MSNVSAFAAVQAYLSRGEDLFLIEIGWQAMIAVGILLVSLSLARVTVPYGRHTWKGGLLLPLPAKLGWFVQEAPALCVPLFLITNVGGRYLGKINANTILLGMFLLHYVHRWAKIICLVGVWLWMGLLFSYTTHSRETFVTCN